MGRKPMPKIKWDNERVETLQNEVLWKYELPKDRKQKELLDLIKSEFTANGFACSSFGPDDHQNGEFTTYGLLIKKNDSFFMKICGLRLQVHISSGIDNKYRQVHLKPTYFYQDKIIAGIIGFILPILWITAGIGFFQQLDMTEKIKNVIRRYLAELPQEETNEEDLVDLDLSDIDEIRGASDGLGEPEPVGEDGIPVSFSKKK